MSRSNKLSLHAATWLIVAAFLVTSRVHVGSEMLVYGVALGCCILAGGFALWSRLVTTR